MTNSVIHTEGLVKRYGDHTALHHLDLTVQPGEVFGFLGPNGAGKTTTIRLLLDLIRPSSGQVRVLGRDPRRDGVAIRRRVGYLPGDLPQLGRQPVWELLTFLGNVRGGVDRQRIRVLAERLDLDLSRPVRSLSKGNRQKVGLVQAFMHDPDLLILDEPTSGLDPLVQQTFLELVREVRAAGRTVFMSSHILLEVEQSADRIGIVREGRLVAVERVEALRERAPRRVEIEFAGPAPIAAFRDLPGVDDVSMTEATDGDILRCRLTGQADALVKAAAGFTVISLRSTEPSLDELFFNYYRVGEESHAA